MDEEQALGYAFEHEDVEHLHGTSSPFSVGADAYQAPDEIDHRSWLQVKNQVQVSSCTGHAESSSLEICNFIGSGGNVISLSRMFAYLIGQKESNLFGQDKGATISGVVKGSKEYGICLETTFPYPGVYDTTIPNGSVEEAVKRKLLKHSVLNDYMDVFNWLASGVGAVILGIQWVDSIRLTTGVVNYLSGNSKGGHALCLAGYSKRLDTQGRKYIWLVNSHGVKWGNKGWAEIAPSVVDQWCSRRGSEVIGVSDLQDYGPRSIPNWLGVSGYQA